MWASVVFGEGTTGTVVEGVGGAGAVVGGVVVVDVVLDVVVELELELDGVAFTEDEELFSGGVVPAPGLEPEPGPVPGVPAGTEETGPFLAAWVVSVCTDAATAAAIRTATATTSSTAERRTRARRENGWGTRQR